jgi:hypothetical protein
MGGLLNIGKDEDEGDEGGRCHKETPVYSPAVNYIVEQGHY